MTTKQDIIKTLSDSAFEMEAMLDTPACNDMIFAWPSSGLGVFWAKSGPKVVGVMKATAIDDRFDNRTFTNGAGERAQKMLRSRALKTAILGLNKAIAAFSEKE